MARDLRERIMNGADLEVYHMIVLDLLEKGLDKKLNITDISDWAKASTKPSYTAKEVGAIPASMESEFALKSELANLYRWKGSVNTYNDLPKNLTNNEIGWVYDVKAEKGMNYGWTGTYWDALGELFVIDYLTDSEVLTILEGT